jgi:hypothetical protein
LGRERDLAATVERQCGGMGGHCTRVAGRGHVFRSTQRPAFSWQTFRLELQIRVGGHRNCYGGGCFRRTSVVRFSASLASVDLLFYRRSLVLATTRPHTLSRRLSEVMLIKGEGSPTKEHVLFRFGKKFDL